MGECGSNKHASSHGVTLIELLVTLVIVFILASVALPVAKVSTKRAQELELRQTLRTIRVAIDKFRDDWHHEGANSNEWGQKCQKNQLSCKEGHASRAGYPTSLESLLGVKLSGGESLSDDTVSIVRYLRKIPIDPMTGTTDWGLRCYQDDVDEDRWCDVDVYDVFTKSEKLAIDGTPYREW